MNCVSCFVASKGQTYEEAIFVFEGRSWCLTHFFLHFGTIQTKKPQLRPMEEGYADDDG